MTQIVDLTYGIHNDMLTFHTSWHPKVSIKQMGEIKKVGRETRSVFMGTHTGTHIDAPKHFCLDGKTIDEIPLEALMGTVSIVDFSGLEENSCVSVAMLEKLKVTPKMIFKFGWGKHWGNQKYYYNYPYFSLESVEFLLKNGVHFIGMDTPSPDDSRIPLGSERDSEIHKYLLANNIVIVEYLANLDTVTDYENWTVVALPLKILNGDGAPGRVCIFR